MWAPVRIRRWYGRKLPQARAGASRPTGAVRRRRVREAAPYRWRNLQGREGQAPPTGFEKTFRFCVGEPLGAPARICTGTVGSEKPGAEVEPHQLQFLSSQVPVAREESRKPLRFWAPGMTYNFSGGCPQ